MTLIIILGPAAVGKMTVGQALAALTGFKLLHNHMTSELARHFFPVRGEGNKEGRRLKDLFTQEILEAVAKSDNGGMIFTNMLDFDRPVGLKYIQDILDMYAAHGAKTCVVELYADLETRVTRNKTENRLLHKPEKHDIVESERLLRYSNANQRHNTHEGEYPFANYLKIDNTYLSPEAVADMIRQKFLAD
ncbi:MAG: AAA family ATPase [Defluviitaleaceae bacterium]|nr:AAA family ATPase [Defluviitaleaceae bacterium]MCL2263949.1 AAA family ATPase [Defluviitaleaceae bacterium]